MDVTVRPCHRGGLTISANTSSGWDLGYAADCIGTAISTQPEHDHFDWTEQSVDITCKDRENSALSVLDGENNGQSVLKGPPEERVKMIMYTFNDGSDLSQPRYEVSDYLISPNDCYRSDWTDDLYADGEEDAVYEDGEYSAEAACTWAEARCNHFKSTFTDSARTTSRDETSRTADCESKSKSGSGGTSLISAYEAAWRVRAKRNAEERYIQSQRDLRLFVLHGPITVVTCTSGSDSNISSSSQSDNGLVMLSKDSTDLDWGYFPHVCSRIMTSPASSGPTIFAVPDTVDGIAVEPQRLLALIADVRSRRFGETVDNLTASRIFAVTQNDWKSVHAEWSQGKLEGGRLVERLEGHARGQRALRL